MKSAMRQICKDRRLAIAEKISKDEAIFSRLIASDSYQSARRIMTYVSLPDEVDTHRFIRHALKQDKLIFVPKVLSKTEMVLCRIKSFEDLKPGKKGILEPDAIDLSEAESMDLILVPGLGYTCSGFRIGYGGGYYDRLISKVNCDTVGLCYEQCLFDALPTEPHDMPVDAIVTEEREMKTWGMTT